VLGLVGHEEKQLGTLRAQQSHQTGQVYLPAHCRRIAFRNLGYTSLLIIRRKTVMIMIARIRFIVRIHVMIENAIIIIMTIIVVMNSNSNNNNYNNKNNISANNNNNNNSNNKNRKIIKKKKKKMMMMICMNH